MEKIATRRSFRPATFATASTWTGITAKSAAATDAAGSARPTRRPRRSTRTQTAAWRRTFVRWKPNGSSPPRA